MFKLNDLLLLLPPILMFVCCRAQAIAIGQALVDGRWLDCVTHNDQLFRDEYALYRPLQVTFVMRKHWARWKKNLLKSPNCFVFAATYLNRSRVDID